MIADIKDYIVTFNVKNNNTYTEYTNFDYNIEALSKAHAIGMAFQLFFADHNDEKIEDYAVEVLINGKYEFI